MNKLAIQRAQLLAPCGMDCGVCSAYLAYANQIPRKRGEVIHCEGCRARGKHCAYLKGHCVRLASGQVNFCFECPKYPCERLKHLDERYRKRYTMSLIENLELIKKAGVQALIENQQARYNCPTCGQLRSVHNQRCFACEKALSLRSG